MTPSVTQLITGNHYSRLRDTDALSGREWMWWGPLEPDEQLTIHHAPDSEPLARITLDPRPAAGYLVQKLVFTSRNLPDANRWAVEAAAVTVGWNHDTCYAANAVLLGPLVIGSGMYADAERVDGEYPWGRSHGGISMHVTTLNEDTGRYNTGLSICMPDEPYHGMGELTVIHSPLSVPA